MRKTAILTLAMSVVALSIYADGVKLKNKMGIGYAASATATPTEFVFEQSPADELISNGTFGSTNNWARGAGWAIAGGVATYTNPAAGTNTLTQSSLALTDREEYRLTYTISTINGGATITPYIGTTPYTARTTTGTFTEDVTFFGASNFLFSIAAADGATGVVDNVSIYQKPEAAFVDHLVLSTTNLAPTVYFNFNCTAAQFTNLYLRSKCMELVGGQPLELPSKQPIYNMWYRTASATETVVINGL